MSGVAREEKQAGERGRKRPLSPRWGFVSLCLSILLPSLATSIANVALPTLTQAFAVPFQDVQWVVVAYLLTITSVIVGVGRLGDLAGRRRLLLAGIVLFTAASLLSGLSPTLWVLIAARALQGLGAAVMIALAIALVGQTVLRENTGSAIGLLGTMSAIGTALGPSLGGILITLFGWRAIFFVSVPLGIAAVVLAARSLPADVSNERADFDMAGMLWLAVALSGYTLAITLGQGSFGALNLGLLLVATLAAAVFVRVERRTASPLIPLAIFRDPSLTPSLVMSALVSTVMMATLVVGPFYLSQALGLDAAAVGLVVSSGPFVAAVMAAPAGRLADRFGTRRTTIAGLIGLEGGSVLLCLGAAQLGIAGYVGSIVAVTASYAVFQTANNTGVMIGVHPTQRGVVSGMLNLSRNLGLITGTSAMGAVYWLASTAAGRVVAAPEAAAVGLRVTFAVATLLVVIALTCESVFRRVLAHAAVESGAPGGSATVSDDVVVALPGVPR